MLDLATLWFSLQFIGKILVWSWIFSPSLAALHHESEGDMYSLGPGREICFRQLRIRIRLEWASVVLLPARCHLRRWHAVILTQPRIKWNSFFLSFFLYWTVLSVDKYVTECTLRTRIKAYTWSYWILSSSWKRVFTKCTVDWEKGYLDTGVVNMGEGVFE